MPKILMVYEKFPYYNLSGSASACCIGLNRKSGASASPWIRATRPAYIDKRNQTIRTKRSLSLHVVADSVGGFAACEPATSRVDRIVG